MVSELLNYFHMAKYAKHSEIGFMAHDVKKNMGQGQKMDRDKD